MFISATPSATARGDMGGSYAAPAYTAPAGGYSAPVGGGPSGFAEIDEEDGDLPF